MSRPPIWVWALPSAVALGLVLGLRLRPVTRLPPELPPTPSARASVRPAFLPARPMPDEASVPDSVAWGAERAMDHPLDGGSTGDTLPAAPAEAGVEPHDAEIEPRELPLLREGPVQGLARDLAYSRPLIATVRGGGRVSFYSAWDAPPKRVSLVGDWARVGSCGDVVRLGYEQAAAGLGAVRGAGHATGSPSWHVAVVLARQHCAAAASRWRGSRSPKPEEIALISPLLAGERPEAVVMEGNGIWAASDRRAVVARLCEGRVVEQWSAAAPEGAVVRFLGVWEGDGLWAAVRTGGRIVRVWRVPRSG